MAYFQLFTHSEGVRDCNEAPGHVGWSIDFGDRDEEAVTFERDDWRDKGVPSRFLRIVKFARVPTAKQLWDAQSKLNAAPPPAAMKAKGGRR